MRLHIALLLLSCGGRTELGVPVVIDDEGGILLADSGARDSSVRDAPRGDACRGAITLQITSTVPWTDTGIDVASGAHLTIKATGKVIYGPQSVQVTDANGGNYDGQKFFLGAVLPNTIIVSLIGKTGGTTAPDTGAPLPEGKPGNGPGFVGVSYDMFVPVGGRLFLGFNDQRGNFGDNSGAFTVTLSTGC